MKKIVLLAAIICFAGSIFAQSDKYKEAMKTNIALLDSIMINGNGVELANKFERIGDAEKTQWLPYYYAAYATIMEARGAKDNSKNDAIADRAQQLLDKASTIYGKDNSEIYVIKSLIATSRMTVDPQSRYMTYGPEIAAAIDKAKSLDPTNPRPVLIEAENTFYTPEAFGGGKEPAKKLFDQAKTLDESFKPETDLSPTWGKGATDYFLAQYK